jgi:hypothetical protein
MPNIVVSGDKGDVLIASVVNETGWRLIGPHAAAQSGWVCVGVTVARIGATERAIERIGVEVSCEYGLSHGYDIISLGHSMIRISDVTMTSSE